MARRTDTTAGNRAIGFALDDRFLSDGPHSEIIKITYRDVGSARWALVYATPDGPAQREIRSGDSGDVKTATFALTDACFPAKGFDYDFEIQALDGDATVSFVRVIKGK